jgi:HEAT repeat protein
MTCRKRLSLGLALVAGCIAAAVVVLRFDHIRGWCRGEAFYNGRYSGYWLREVKAFAPGWHPPDANTRFWSKLREWLFWSHRGEDKPIPAVLVDGGPDVVAVLIDLLRDGDGPVRKEVLRRLEGTEAEAAEAVPAVRAALADPELRDSAFRALLSIGSLEDAVDALASDVHDENDARTYKLYLGYRLSCGVDQKGTSDSCVPFLARVLDDDASLRLVAAHALRERREAARQALPSLRRALHDADADVRIEAGLAVWGLEHDSNRVIPVLVRGLSEKDALTRANAADALRDIGPAAKVAVPALRSALKDASESVRWAATEALGCIDPEATKRAALEQSKERSP